MKTQTTNKMKTSMNVLFAAALAFALNTNTAAAQSATTPENQLQVKCVDKSTDHLTFQLDFPNEANETYFLSVKDEAGTVVYGERIKDNSYSRRFRWTNEYDSPNKLVFTLTSDKGRKTQVVEVNSSYQVLQDVTISKL